MPPICAKHQFEIKYTNILNFPVVIIDAVSPFIKHVNRISINNENSHAQEIILHFDEQFSQISIRWDRIIFLAEGIEDITHLKENNSVIEEPFFNLLSKIKELKGFGEVKSSVFYSVFVELMDRDIDEIKNNFVEKYLKQSELSNLMEFTDVGVAITKENEDSHINAMFGPYLGIEELKRRNIQNIIDSFASYGEIVEFKYADLTKKHTFKRYKEIFEVQNKFIKKLWS